LQPLAVGKVMRLQSGDRGRNIHFKYQWVVILKGLQLGNALLQSNRKNYGLNNLEIASMSAIRKKLIEVALPLDAINKASAREKSIRHGHPSTLHLWWARRPLAAARAVIFAQMVDDPSAHPDLFPTEKKQEKERQRLFRIIEDLVLWENTTNEKVLQQARDEIWQSWRYTCAENADHPRAKELFDRYKLPAFHDPFAGGGSLPLEAQRLGLEAYASDLNPVAVLICKAMIEIPPKFAGKPPVNPDYQTLSPGGRGQGEVTSSPGARWSRRTRTWPAATTSRPSSPLICGRCIWARGRTSIRIPLSSSAAPILPKA
jgi:hypothetical protein